MRLDIIQFKAALPVDARDPRAVPVDLIFGQGIPEAMFPSASPWAGVHQRTVLLPLAALVLGESITITLGEKAPSLLPIS